MCAGDDFTTAQIARAIAVSDRVTWPVRVVPLVSFMTASKLKKRSRFSLVGL